MYNVKSEQETTAQSEHYRYLTLNIVKQDFGPIKIHGSSATQYYVTEMEIKQICQQKILSLMAGAHTKEKF